MRMRIATLAALLSLAACSVLTGPDERIFTLEIAESRATCHGLFDYQCMQARERPDQPFTLFYSSIQDFDYEEGFRYVIDVAERTIPDPPADGSSIAYRLIVVRSKTRVVPVAP